MQFIISYNNQSGFGSALTYIDGTLVFKGGAIPYILSHFAEEEYWRPWMGTREKLDPYKRGTGYHQTWNSLYIANGTYGNLSDQGISVLRFLFAAESIIRNVNHAEEYHTWLAGNPATSSMYWRVANLTPANWRSKDILRTHDPRVEYLIVQAVNQAWDRKTREHIKNIGRLITGHATLDPWNHGMQYMGTNPKTGGKCYSYEGFGHDQLDPRVCDPLNEALALGQEWFKTPPTKAQIDRWYSKAAQERKAFERHLREQRG